jgi:ribosomal-protein-alanine N-acetyltransferase
VTVRPATADDVDVVAALEAENFGADAWSPGLVADGVTGGLPTVRYLVAEVDDVVVGYAVASFVADVAELQRIVVDPGHRRRGLATALLRAVADEGVREHADRVLLEVRETNRVALAFYAAHGFVELARRPRYYRDGTLAVVLALALTGPDVNEWVTA